VPEAAVAIRPAIAADIPAVIALYQAAIDVGEFGPWTSANLAMLLTTVRGQPAKSFVAVDDNIVVGAITPYWETLVVAPFARRRGYGRALVAAAAETAGEVVLTPPTDSPTADAFLAVCGFVFSHNIIRMHRTADAPAGPPAPATGWSLCSYDKDNVRGYVALINRVFADLSSPLALDEDDVVAAQAKPGFDPSFIAVLVHDANPTALRGFCRTIAAEEESGSRLGEVSILGVDRDARGLGNGRALLRWGISRLRAAGCSCILIEVDAADTAAYGLYLAEGFVPVSRSTTWKLPAAD